MAFYKVRGRRIPMVHIEQCRTCTHPRRRLIERLLIDGVVPRVIAERLKNQVGPSEASIRRHYARGHMPVDARTVVERQDERAEARWRQHGEVVTKHFRTEYRISQLIVSEFHRRVQSGRVRLTMNSAVEACDLINRMERQAAEAERTEQSERRGVISLLNAIDGLLDVVHDVVGDDAWVEVIDRAKRDVFGFLAWSHHPRLSRTMAQHRQVDEGRTHAYRNIMRARWAKVGRKNYGPANPDHADLGPFTHEVEEWVKRLSERAA